MQRNSRPIIIGITGYMGSGKSTVCRIIEKHYPVEYADLIAHQVLLNSEVIKNLTSKWGSILFSDESLNTKAIAEIVFKDKSELAYLNQVIHPRVLEIMQSKVNSSISDIIFFEVPLLFEEDLQDCFDYIVYIKASPGVILQRAAVKSSFSEEDMEQRLKMQNNEAYQMCNHLYLIKNEGSISDLENAVDTFILHIPTITKRDIKPFII